MEKGLWDVHKTCVVTSTLLPSDQAALRDPGLSLPGPRASSAALVGELASGSPQPAKASVSHPPEKVGPGSQHQAPVGSRRYCSACTRNNSTGHSRPDAAHLRWPRDRLRDPQRPSPLPRPHGTPGTPTSLPALPYPFLVFFTLEDVSTMRSQCQHSTV